MHLGPAQPPEFIAALEVLFAHLPASSVTDRIAAARTLLENPTNSPAQLLVARRGNSIIGASLMQVLDGATGVIWPPRSDLAEIEDALVGESVSWLKLHGAKLAQSILAVNEAFLGECLVRNGFQHPTQMCYLQHDLQVDLPKPADGFEPVGDDNRPAFEDVLRRSYVDSQDFPEVNDRQTLEDVLRGHKSEGIARGNWWLFRDAGEPIGVLMLAECDDGQGRDLVYLGVVPEARGRGWGRELIRQALVQARSARAGGLTVCVDARNKPARRLYDEMGFVEYDRRDVFLALWENP
jgi:mycothiol synthase